MLLQLLEVATSSKKRSLAFIESFSGLFVSSVCSLSSLSKAWYGFVGKRRGERNKVSITFEGFMPASLIAF